jgi:hypothetical protein
MTLRMTVLAVAQQLIGPQGRARMSDMNNEFEPWLINPDTP